nr:capsule assembly Wzi family protein [Parabacteroides pacaensis]
MKVNRIFCEIGIGIVFPWMIICAQNEKEEERAESTVYRVEAFGSIAKEDNTPFWMVSNQYGILPLEAGNGYLKAGVFHSQSFGDMNRFHWSAGADFVVAAPRYKNVFVQQLYAEIGYRCLQLRIGSKEDYTSLWDRQLSSGDMVQSANARPIPEINLSIPRFTVIPLTQGWLQIKGDFAVGRSFDTKYLEHFAATNQIYIKNVLWHHKSLFLQIKDTKGEKPLSVILGARHTAQWGGTSTNPKIGKQPQSLKDFLRVMVGKEGGANASLSDQINVLGNHYGSFDLKVTYEHKDWTANLYWQHYFEDNSGLEYANVKDGLWGAQLRLSRFKWIRNILIEYFNTKNQSGTMHFINYDRPSRGGGADNYYNNGEYVTGVSYFGRALGSPLITSPEYNTDGGLTFKNNRITSYHFGAEGTLSEYIDYRILFSVMNSWGTTYHPFINNKKGVSGLLEVIYHHPKLIGWEFKGLLAADARALYGNNVGFGLSVAKRGILKRWTE